MEEGVGAWLAETLELPEGWKHDPDIVWQQLGITWIAFDEAHNGKNLHMPSSREGGSVPKFMGNEGEGSHRAWHWYFRCCDVQSRGGEVVLATATPASNSPLEFYNLVKLIDDKAWTRIGIHDPEAFIDRFCLLEPEEVVTVDLQTQTRMACVGFKNLDELRSVLMKAWEFKTAKQARLKLPTPTIRSGVRRHGRRPGEKIPAVRRGDRRCARPPERGRAQDPRPSATHGERCPARPARREVRLE